MTTSAYEYNYQDCEKIDGRQVNAYIEASLNVENPVELDISTTWGDSKVDLTDAVKAAETVTSLELVPADNPTAIQFNREDGGVDCISGDDLSRIISLTKLKDSFIKFISSSNSSFFTNLIPISFIFLPLSYINLYLYYT